MPRGLNAMVLVLVLAGAACSDSDATEDSGDASVLDAAPAAPVPCTNSLDCVGGPGQRTICSTRTQLCVECVVAADCDGPAACSDNVCVPYDPCETALDCDGGEICDPVTRRCVGCAATSDCADGSVCAANVCRTSCQSDKVCTPSGLLCDFDAAHCVECLEAGDCPDDQVCEAGRCADRSCAPLTCAALKGACGAIDDGCGTELDCGPCATSHCADGMANDDETDVDCGGASCAPCASGRLCKGAGDCSSGLCTGLFCALPQTGECGAGTKEIGRYAEWCGKVNLHTDDNGAWATDADCTTGCGQPTLTYCRKYYPDTESTVSVAATGEPKPFENAACANVYPYVGTTEVLCCGAL